MKKFSIAQRIFLSVLILLLTGCGGGNSGNPDVQVNELSNSPTSYDETVHINNCGGKADSEQTKSRSFSTDIQGGIDVGVQQIVEGIISAKYSQSRNASVSQKLVAPAGTNMEFVLRWSEEVHAGNVTVNGSTGTYTASIPVAVEQLSGQDLGCPGGIQVQPPTNNQPTNSGTLSRCELIQQNFPQSAEAIASKFGIPINSVFDVLHENCGGNIIDGFVYRSNQAVELTVPDGGCIDAPPDAYFSDTTSSNGVGGSRAFSGIVRASAVTYRMFCYR